LGTPTSDQTQTLAEARFKKKELQLQEGEKAMAEYVAAGIAEREKTARLRALREAKEAAEAAKRAQAAVGPKRKAVSARNTRATLDRAGGASES
jgi:hypothetical protein